MLVTPPPCAIIAIKTVPKTETLRTITVLAKCRGSGGYQITLNRYNNFVKRVVVSSDYRPAYFIRTFTMTAQEIRTTTVNIRAFK